MIIVDADFLPILESIRDKMETVKMVVVISEDESRPDSQLTLDGEYEELLKSVSALYDFPDLDENTKRTTFYTTDTIGNPKGVYFLTPTISAPYACGCPCMRS